MKRSVKVLKSRCDREGSSGIDDDWKIRSFVREVHHLVMRSRGERSAVVSIMTDKVRGGDQGHANSGFLKSFDCLGVEEAGIGESPDAGELRDGLELADEMSRV